MTRPESERLYTIMAAAYGDHVALVVRKTSVKWHKLEDAHDDFSVGKRTGYASVLAELLEVNYSTVDHYLREKLL